MYYPLNLDLRGKPCLVVGGGKVALQKARGLLAAGALPTIVSPRMTRPVKRLGKKAGARLVRRPFREKDLHGKSLVIVATDDRECNGKIGRLCRDRRILVNVVDRPGLSSFTVPSVFRRGPLAVAVSTQGASPALSKKIRKDLARTYGRGVGTLARFLGNVRKEAMANIADPERRRQHFERVLRSDALARIRRGDRRGAARRVREILFGKSSGPNGRRR